MNKSYFICSTCRSGSTLLCEALMNTGIAGIPREYFWAGNEHIYYHRRKISTYREFLNLVKEDGSTPNGVFGAKVMKPHIDLMINQLKKISNYIPEQLVPVRELLSSHFPDVHFLFITRRNKIRQAVSFAKAMQTGRWRGGYGEPASTSGQVTYDYSTIDNLVQYLTIVEAEWQDFFWANSIIPYTVIYEDFEQRYEQTAIDILNYLNIDISSIETVGERKLVKEANAISEEWVTRYMTQKSCGIFRPHY